MVYSTNANFSKFLVAYARALKEQEVDLNLVAVEDGMRKSGFNFHLIAMVNLALNFYETQIFY